MGLPWSRYSGEKEGGKEGGRKLLHVYIKKTSVGHRSMTELRGGLSFAGGRSRQKNKENGTRRMHVCLNQSMFREAVICKFSFFRGILLVGFGVRQS
jgi:hypothetical protein